MSSKRMNKKDYAILQDYMNCNINQYCKCIEPL